MSEKPVLTLHSSQKDELWSKLAKSDNGAPRPTHANLQLIFRHDPALWEMVQHNCFSGQHLITRAPPCIDAEMRPAPGPYPRALAEGDIVRVLSYAQQRYAHGFKKSTVTDCLIAEADDRQIHPVRSWLDGLTWDGTARIDRWLVMTFGVLDDEYHRAVASKLLLAAVRRVRRPGCKFDHMVVLEGAQGMGKSRSIATLFGEDWYTDQIADLVKKDAAIDLFGKWVVELSEIDHLVRSEVETVKAFLSRCADRYRPPYEKQSRDFPRQCVFIGTTNSDEYLRDTTGNRRIWPVRCRSSGEADVAWLAEHREQLWAEASQREASGETIWLDNPNISDTASKLQASRMIEDPWSEIVRAYVSDKTAVTISEILDQALNIPKREWGKSQQMRAGNILRDAGWKRTEPTWDSALGKNIRSWRRGDILPGLDEE